MVGEVARTIKLESALRRIFVILLCFPAVAEVGYEDLAATFFLAFFAARGGNSNFV